MLIFLTKAKYITKENQPLGYSIAWREGWGLFVQNLRYFFSKIALRAACLVLTKKMKALGYLTDRKQLKAFICAPDRGRTCTDYSTGS